MSEHAPSSQPVLQGMGTHEATYKGFLDFSVAGSIICIYIVVALVTFRFVDNPLNVFVGFGGILIGFITSLVALRLGGKWLVAMVPLVLFGLFVAANAHMS